MVDTLGVDIGGVIIDRVDDSYLDTVSYKILFNPDESEVNRYEHAYSQVIRADSWPEVEKLLPSRPVVVLFLIFPAAKSGVG